MAKTFAELPPDKQAHLTGIATAAFGASAAPTPAQIAALIQLIMELMAIFSSGGA